MEQLKNILAGAVEDAAARATTDFQTEIDSQAYVAIQRLQLLAARAFGFMSESSSYEDACEGEEEAQARLDGDYETNIDGFSAYLDAVGKALTEARELVELSKTLTKLLAEREGPSKLSAVVSLYEAVVAGTKRANA
jgi:hypothetical protein